MSELTQQAYEQDCKPLAPMASTLDKLRGVVRHPFGYGVMDKTCLDLEFYATREDAIERARECHRKYPYIRPFRVVKITLEPIKDDADSDPGAAIDSIEYHMQGDAK